MTITCLKPKRQPSNKSLRRRTPSPSSPPSSSDANSPKSSSPSNPYSYVKKKVLSLKYKKKLEFHEEETPKESNPPNPNTLTCSSCGVSFTKNQLVEHQAINHAVSELVDGDPAANIVRTIFQTGWTDKEKTPTIEKILKIHHTAEILHRFEEYREMVKSTAAKANAGKRMERWVVDGNEVLRFHGSSFTCPLGYDGNSSICGHKSCTVCRIIQSCVMEKYDQICLYEDSSRAHEKAVGGESEKRAVLICRVIAGQGIVKGGEEGAVVSLVEQSRIQADGLQELCVFDRRAVLPCFVIIYAVQ